MASVQKDSLQSLLAGEPIPNLPAFDPKWSLKQYNDEIANWQRKLFDYLRRLLQRLTGPNIFNEIIQQSTINQYITQIVSGIAGTSYGFGPVKIDVFADTNVTNGGSFNGTKIGTIYHSSISIENMQNWVGIQPLQNPNCASVRIQTRVVSPMTGDITFTLSADDGARFYVNGVLAVDSWGTTPGSFDYVYTATTGELINIKVEAENSGGGGTFSARIIWSGSGISTSSPKLSELRSPLP